MNNEIITYYLAFLVYALIVIFLYGMAKKTGSFSSIFLTISFAISPGYLSIYLTTMDSCDFECDYLKGGLDIIIMSLLVFVMAAGIHEKFSSSESLSRKVHLVFYGFFILFCLIKAAIYGF